MDMMNDTMNHNKMNHSTMIHDTMSMSSMKVYFHASEHATTLFEGWHTMTWAEMLGSCIGIAVLAILYEGLKMLRKFVDIKLWRPQVEYSVGDVSGSADDCKMAKHVKQRVGILQPAHLLQTLLHFIQLWISFSLMLVFMTFNVYLCLAVTVGGAIGYFCFAWIQQPSDRNKNAGCH